MAGITQRFLDPSRAVTRRLDPKALVVEWVIGLPPQSRFEMTLAVAFGLARAQADRHRGGRILH
jgi:hypothetical protein